MNVARTVYLLRLQSNKYYVGRTSNLWKRLAQHASGKGSAWTKRHKLVRLVDTEHGDGCLEEKWTLKAMDTHGVDNVRGGSYSQLKLSKAHKEKAKQQIRAIFDRCFVCGGAGHFASQCPNK